jgi:NADPH-dependent 2,4-dienoyl-CoA reductase/sulfur reductase-like enzyme/rhodanese-related sulfurtransferase
MSKKIVIIGGVAGGASVAARVRRLDEHAHITMFEKGPHVSFSNCSLPFYLSGTVADINQLVLISPETFLNRYNIEAKVNSEVVKIVPDQKKVIVKDVITGDLFEEPYDALYLSPGARPIMPKNISGIDKKHVFSVRNVVDIDRIDHYIKDNHCKKAAVVGGGYIGLEIVENLKDRGLEVTLIEAAEQIMKPIDYDMVQIVHQEIVSHGVELIVGEAVCTIQDDKIITNQSKEIGADIVIMAIGVIPETSLAVDAGIKLGASGAIQVNHNYLTNIPHIYAVGDAIEVHHALLHGPTRLTLAGPALREARAAADHLYGRPVHNKGFIGSSSVRVFNMNIASTGLNAKQCDAHNIQYDYVYIMPCDRVSIMPEVQTMHLKVLFEVPTGKLLGCQAVGKGEVVKRIDVMAAMITMSATLYDLTDLELCYSPTYSTPRDPLNHAALVGVNILNGEFKQVKVSEVRRLVESKAFILDVREKSEYDSGHIKGAKHIPMGEIRNRLDEIPKDQNVYVHCRSGQRSYNIVRTLTNLGYEHIYNISGSFLGISYYEYYLDQQLKRDPIVTQYNFI